MPQNKPKYAPPRVSQDEMERITMARMMTEAYGGGPDRDEYGYISPNRRRMQELLIANANAREPYRTDISSDAPARPSVLGTWSRRAPDATQDRLYQAQLIMDALEQARAAKAGRRKP